MAALEPFHAMDVMTRAHELERQGRSIIHMEVGESDFATPQPVLDAAARALQKGNLPHTLALGLPDLREAIARYYENRYRIGILPERIVVTSGSCLLSAFSSIPAYKIGLKVDQLRQRGRQAKRKASISPAKCNTHLIVRRSPND